ncbi:putative ABC transport system permease protein [Catalinimonas alkaloidigena]|uniref:ABC transporter permease n=1 Tax=Catalinimonas alkaloidigena TaxID=1075417 RepID=UPI002405752F|nr:ABC transporter permease [Catalinimonas alkaloidigena]MDF9797480.1 putative ABC transport system permease protein [Catalinimonas alkaloidigena]
MFWDNTTIAYRNLIKHKFYSTINLLGLAIGTAACLMILHYVRYELSYEDFHDKAANIYRLTLDAYKDGELLVQDAEMYPLAGPELKAQMPEVIDYVRLHDENQLVVGHDDYRQHESSLYFTDPSFFSIFSIDVLQGDPNTALDDPFEIVITASKARQYFGTTDVVGKALDLYGMGREVKNARISAVIKDLPPNTHLKIDFLLSFISLQDEALAYQLTWNGNNEFTYLLMDTNFDKKAFEAKLNTFTKNLKDEIGDEKFSIQAIRDIHLHSHKTYEPEVNGDGKTVSFLSIIAFFILIIAWVNYINLATARSVERAKEVGIKKALGCTRVQLIKQFMLEALLTNITAMLLAMLIVYLGFSAFRQLSGQPLEFRLFNDPYFGLLLVGMVIFGTLLSGLYPSFVLSSFRPTSVLKGKLRSSSHGRWLRQSLVVFQFLASVVLMVGTFTVYQQLNFMRDQELGLNTEQLLVIELPMDLRYDSQIGSKLVSLQEEWKRISNVEVVAGAQAMPGSGYDLLSSSSGIYLEGDDKRDRSTTYYHYGMDANYLQSLGSGMLAGHTFRKGTDNSHKIVINKKAASMLGFENPEEAIGQKITFDSISTIIGVVENYHFHSLKEPITPFIHWYSDLNVYQYIRLNISDIQYSLSQLESTFKGIFPNSTFSYSFLDDTYNQQYLAEVRFGKVFSLFAALAIVVACLGLLGLSSYTSIQRTKEIGIRKALGASVGNILFLLSKSYFQLIIIALFIAVPIANYFMSEWLLQFAYRITINWWLFVLPGILVICIALLAISGQTVKSARANPVKSLRYE